MPTKEGKANPWNHPFRRLKMDPTLLGGLQESTEANQPLDQSEWTEAKELKSGDLTFTADGKLLAISSIEVDGREETVYNFEVEDFHTYFVGEVGVWVHNDSYIVITPKKGVAHSSDYTDLESFILVEGQEIEIGLGLSKLAEKILIEKGEKLTKKSVEAQMEIIKSLNPDLFNLDKNPKQFLYEGDLVKIEKERGPAETTILDDIPMTYGVKMSGVPKVILRTLNWGGKAIEKAAEKVNQKKNYKQVSQQDRENWNSMIKDNRNQLVKDNIQIFKALNIKPDFEAGPKWLNENLPDFTIGFINKEYVMEGLRPKFEYTPEGFLIIKDKSRTIVTDKHMSKYNN